MWQGMLSIFLVIGIIILSVVVMNKLTNRPKNKD
ncbi:MAG: sodium pump decarboxylase gamma subunit [Ruminococcaceae bacterium]|nr:sodium pump decarboxylase gamma subunit [Oscillospiraceae bacterium]